MNTSTKLCKDRSVYVRHAHANFRQFKTPNPQHDAFIAYSQRWIKSIMNQNLIYLSD